MRSLIVEVRKAVVAGIEQTLNQPQVSVTYGWRGGDDERREQVYTNRPRATHEPAALAAGRTRRNERMDFDIVVMVIDPSRSPEEVDERALEIGQVIEEWVADHKGGDGLGITGLNWLKVTAFEMENRVMPTGSATLAQYTVQYDARLT